MDSKGNVRRVFLACVLHALGWCSNPAGKGNVRSVFLACVLHALGWNPLAFKCFGTVPPRDIGQWFC